METNTYPKASLQPMKCRRCKEGRAESGGYRERKHRDLAGVRIERVLRVRCSKCKRSLGCVYPDGVLRYKWYSIKVQGIFGILDVHQVKEACVQEVAAWLGYTVESETRAAWQATQVWRSEQYEAKDVAAKAIELTPASLDECKVGTGWMYTLSDVKSQALVAHAPTATRNENTVRTLLSEHEPEVLISDGCPQIEAALAYLPDIQQARCWFHVIKDVLHNFKRDERERVAWDLKFLYTRAELQEAEDFLKVLKARYQPQQLSPLTKAWEQLKQIWLIDCLPLTNNTSESLYNALWSRTRKRVIKTLERTLTWFKQARWRWNHHLVRGLSPWQRFSGNVSPHWLRALVTPLSRSTDFSG